ncbi:Zn-dependent hydrolase [Primorskyibacter flagellatus]|uniref:Zn-dependent hydrolase n=1 Tax=Primorskyibacter flagellatus TaxID=1387277 RepID=A0A917AGK2_9RHOB|nr:M20/M25/M40 family metallo-hydrolase [Primorskyibacter flagellatus]GGE46949.1 Zn-dependent hydrolase [Primorskyibacter flagellatus]
MTTDTEARFLAALKAREPFLEEMFEGYLAVSRDVEGVTRPAWGEIEEQGLDYVAGIGGSLGLEVSRDELGQLFLTLPGQDRHLPQILIGSHFDSVRRGGHYDGYAGVVTALGTLAAMVDAGITPRRDVTLIGMRGEESPWYGIAYVGSRFTTGDLGWTEMEGLTRIDTGKPFLEHVRMLGYNTDAVRATAGTPRITAQNTAAYLELHIEQGPVLENAGISTAFATAIRGNVRFPEVICRGVYSHASATPYDYRFDTVLACAEVLHRFDLWWQDLLASEEEDSVLTVGRIHTDRDREAMTIVAGECRFAFNFGSTKQAVIEAGIARLKELMEEVGARKKVRFDLGRQAGSVPQPLDVSVRQALTRAAGDVGQEVMEFPAGGHDAGIFAKAGIASSLIFVRNQNGSHNPDEAMEYPHFHDATRVYGLTALRLAEG